MKLKSFHANKINGLRARVENVMLEKNICIKYFSKGPNMKNI